MIVSSVSADEEEEEEGDICVERREGWVGGDREATRNFVEAKARWTCGGTCMKGRRAGEDDGMAVTT